MSFVQNMLCKLDWWWQLWQICNVTLRERESLYMYVWKMCLCANIFVYVNSAFFIELEHYYETPSSKILFLFFEYPYSAIKWQLWQICIELRKFLQRRPLEYNDTYDVEEFSHSNLQMNYIPFRMRTFYRQCKSWKSFLRLKRFVGINKQCLFIYIT